MHLGREALATSLVPVHVLPRLRSFLEDSGPWEQLVRLGNVSLQTLTPERSLTLSPAVSATPILVPHRGEYSETAAFLLAGPRSRGLFIPDIDSWEAWDTPVEEAIAGVDWALLDGTFFSEGELPNRDPTQVCHPLIEASLERLAPLTAKERAKVRFVHLNHTNPALDPESEARRRIESAGFAVAREGERLPL
jgi:pyrroloquinoline quinone biosynthesis protein B